MSPVSCIVVGTGPAGLSTALALSAVGADVLLAGPPPGPAETDTRTAALFTGSLAFLRNIADWEPSVCGAAPLTAIRVVDDGGGLLRAPEVVFSAADVGLEALGANIPNSALATGLWQAIRRQPRITVIETAVTEITLGPAFARIRTREGEEFAAPLIAAADGRNSRCRTAAGIGTRCWDHDQAAIAVTFQHSRPHRGISTEFHRAAGPLTTVPLPGDASSLVWVERAAVARQLMELDASAFTAVLAERLQGLLGRIGPIGQRRLFPLTAMVAERLGQRRVALIGEAGHVMTPVGAQGLNLSLRDGAALAECWVETGANDIEALLARYDDMRRPDVESRSFAVDALNRTLISGLPPVSLARGLALHALKGIAPLRRALIERGLAPGGPPLSLLEPGGGGLLKRAA
jgi:2-octaprenyl-6-methoxyphenol hydroxylase